MRKKNLNNPAKGQSKLVSEKNLISDFHWIWWLDFFIFYAQLPMIHFITRIFQDISAAELFHSLFMVQYIFHTQKFLSHKDLYSLWQAEILCLERTEQFSIQMNSDIVWKEQNNFQYKWLQPCWIMSCQCTINGYVCKWGHSYEHLIWTPMFSKKHKMPWKAIQYMISNWATECLQQKWYAHFSGLSSVTLLKHSDLLLKLRSQVAHSSFPVKYIFQTYIGVILFHIYGF